jgi:hypothetical protein
MAILFVQVIWALFNLYGLPDHLVCVLGLGGKNSGVLELNAMARLMLRLAKVDVTGCSGQTWCWYPMEWPVCPM